jgi:hypothetical protein
MVADERHQRGSSLNPRKVRSHRRKQDDPITSCVSICLFTSTLSRDYFLLFGGNLLDGAIVESQM